MKPSALIPLIALLAGFGAGWLTKPAGPPVAATPPPAASAAPSRPPAPTRPTGALPAPPVRSRVIPGAASGPVPVPGLAPLTLDAAAASKDAAKMLRVVEVLGLSATQQTGLAEILKTTSESYTSGAPTQPGSAKETLALLAKCGTALEQSLAGLLTPDQAAKFTELRQRDRDNRIESRAQRELGRYSELTDLTPTQRAQILAQLRKSTTAEVDAIPAAYALMQSSSVLPLGPRTLPEQSIVALTQIAESSDASNAADAQGQLIAAQRRRLAERLEWLKPILTPAQLAQSEAATAEQRAFHEQMRPPAR